MVVGQNIRKFGLVCLLVFLTIDSTLSAHAIPQQNNEVGELDVNKQLLISVLDKLADRVKTVNSNSPALDKIKSWRNLAWNEMDKFSNLNSNFLARFYRAISDAPDDASTTVDCLLRDANLPTESQDNSQSVLSGLEIVEECLPHLSNVTSAVKSVVESVTEKQQPDLEMQGTRPLGAQGRNSKNKHLTPKKALLHNHEQDSEKHEKQDEEEHGNKAMTEKERARIIFRKTAKRLYKYHLPAFVRFLTVFVLLAGVAVFLAWYHWGLVARGIPEINNLQTGVFTASYWLEFVEAMASLLLVMTSRIHGSYTRGVLANRFQCSHRIAESVVSTIDYWTRITQEKSYSSFMADEKLEHVSVFFRTLENAAQSEHDTKKHHDHHMKDEAVVNDPSIIDIYPDDTNLDLEPIMEFGGARLHFTPHVFYLLSFEQWAHRGATPNEGSPDMLKNLIEVFAICSDDVGDKHLMHELSHEGLRTDVYSKEELDELLKAAYLVHKGYALLGVIRGDVVVDDKKGGVIHGLAEKENELKRMVNKNYLVLFDALAPFWTKMNYAVERFEELEENEEKLEAIERLAQTVVVIFLSIRYFFEFLDLEGECEMLNADMHAIGLPGDEKNAFLRWGYKNALSWHLAPLFHAVRWECNHDLSHVAHHHSASSLIESAMSSVKSIFSLVQGDHNDEGFAMTSHGNVERSAICMLRCEVGYESVQATTYCDGLGGGGMIWTHLNAGTKMHGKGTIHEPGCCIRDSQAIQLNLKSAETNVTDDATNHELTFTWKKGFMRVCRSDGSLPNTPGHVVAFVMQSCSAATKSECSEEGDDKVFDVLSKAAGSSDPHMFLQGATVTNTADIVVTGTDTISKYKLIELEADREIVDIKSEEEMHKYVYNDATTYGKLDYGSSSVKFARLVSFNIFGITHGPWVAVTH